MRWRTLVHLEKVANQQDNENIRVCVNVILNDTPSFPHLPFLRFAFLDLANRAARLLKSLSACRCRVYALLSM